MVKRDKISGGKMYKLELTLQDKKRTEVSLNNALIFKGRKKEASKVFEELLAGLKSVKAPVMEIKTIYGAHGKITELGRNWNIEHDLRPRDVNWGV